MVLLVLTIAAAYVISSLNRENQLSTSSASIENDTWNPAKIQFQAATDSKLPQSQPTPIPKPSKSPVKPVQPQVVATSPISQETTPNPPAKPATAKFQTTSAFNQYQPRYEVILADSSNYGDRFATDAYGTPVTNQPIIVLHETSASATSAINTFRTYHTDESKQVSYHALITLDGKIIYIVPPEKRAYGAGNSVFAGVNGEETVKTNPTLAPSVNNFAYHVSLETPADAWNAYKSRTHGGYTEEQYQALAWLIAQSNVPDDRITTHQLVDRSGTRIDPRSFDFERFFNVLHQFRQAIA
ncbi:N-acetylmuramoyl-L-alanine amidase [Calothrix sp. 336/3]